MIDNILYPYFKVVGSLYVCVSVCKFPHNSGTAGPIWVNTNKFLDQVSSFLDPESGFPEKSGNFSFW